MTVNYLSFHAVERPQAPALINDGREIGYAQFACDLWKFTRAVREFGVVRGTSVAIGCDDFYAHLLLILAFQHLGVTTASFRNSEGAACRPLLESVDLVLAEPHYPPGGWNTRPITEAWLQAVLARPDEGPVPGAAKRPDDILRIVRTSGTTGEPKRFHLLRRMSEARLTHSMWLGRGMPVEGASLILLPWSVGATYEAAMANLRTGRPLIGLRANAMVDVPTLIRRHNIMTLTLLPMQLGQVLDRLPPDWVKAQQLQITAIGAPLSEELRSTTLQRLAGRVTNAYGSNELGAISVNRQPDSGDFSIILPNVEVEIVDDTDAKLPDGTAGHIRVRSESGFRGYLDDETLTAQMLREGWFSPGDIGVLDGRRLQVVGRADDLVNLGGVKYPLTKLEKAVQQSGGAGVEDVGAVPIANAAGVMEIHIGIVTHDTDDQALLRRIFAALRTEIPGDLHFIRLAQVPRNEMGKIDRALLKDAILAHRMQH